MQFRVCLQEVRHGLAAMLPPVAVADKVREVWLPVEDFDGLPHQESDFGIIVLHHSLQSTSGAAIVDVNVDLVHPLDPAAVDPPSLLEIVPQIPERATKVSERKPRLRCASSVDRDDAVLPTKSGRYQCLR